MATARMFKVEAVENRLAQMEAARDEAVAAIRLLEVRSRTPEALLADYPTGTSLLPTSHEWQASMGDVGLVLTYRTPGGTGWQTYHDRSGSRTRTRRWDPDTTTWGSWLTAPLVMGSASEGDALVRGASPGIYVPDSSVVRGAQLSAAVDSRLMQDRHDRAAWVFETPSGYPTRPPVPMVVWFGPNPAPLQSAADEWRPTQGYLYAPNFGRYAAGVLPDEWEARRVLDNQTWEVVEDATALAGRAIRHTSSTYARRLLAYVPADADLHPDQEIVLRGWASNIEDGPHIGGVVRAAGAADSENGYQLALTYGSTLVLQRHLNGGRTDLDNAAFEYAASERVWMRLRAQGNAIKGKAWRDGEHEPDWMIEVQDTAVTLPGAVGLSVFWRDTFYFDYFAAASGGEIATGGA